MQINPSNLPQLAQMLTQERKRQKLSRSQAAAVCNVSPSFIRDAETYPERCSLGKLTLLVNGLGLTISITDWKSQQAQGLINSAIAEGQTGQTATAPGGSERGKGLINSVIPEGQAGQTAMAPGGNGRGKGLINSTMQEGGKRNP